MTTTCHICGFEGLEVFDEYRRFRRVTSDCKPWRPNGSLGTCPHCGTVQAVIDSQWREDAETIYRNYTIYHQAEGSEQQVFDLSGSHGVARSDVLVRHLSESLSLPGAGRLLDVGCGNGSFLRSFSRRFSGWELSGCEVNDKYQAMLESIPGFSSLHVGSLDGIDCQFDVISLIHTLEHIENPRPFLQSLKKLLKPGGLLFVQVPSYVDNPFELLIADHAIHFDQGGLRRLLLDCGYGAPILHIDWVSKEISAIACPPASPHTNDYPSPDIQNRLDWLSRIISDARLVAEGSRNFGIFGSSIGATWLWAELGLRTGYFVDEDSGRLGRTHLGQPILSPSEVGYGDVYAVLSPIASRSVASRLSGDSVKYHGVPDF